MHFFKHAVGEHPLVLAYDEAVSALNKAWDRFNNCPPDETETAILELKIVQNKLDQIIKKAKEQGVEAVTIKSKLADARPPFWLKYIVFRNPNPNRRRIA